MRPRLRHLLVTLALLSPLPARGQEGAAFRVVTVGEAEGEGAVTTVVLTGIAGARHDYLRPEWDRLAEHGRLVYYDQRGCGGSVREGPHSWRHQVRDLDSLIVAMRPAGRLVLAGSGWGATLALLYAYTHPGRADALVLSDLGPWLSPDDYARMDAFERGVLSLEETETWEERRDLAISLATTPTASGEVLDSVLVASGVGGIDARLAPRMGPVCPAVARAIGWSLRDAPPLDSLRAVDLPTLLVRGAGMGLPGYASRYAAVLPRASVVTIDAAQEAWLERPEPFFAAVAGFLRSLPARRD